jgi:hypothetical protein
MYQLVRWAAMDYLVHALRQALLCFIVWIRGVNSAQNPGGETEPYWLSRIWKYLLVLILTVFPGHELCHKMHILEH